MSRKTFWTILAALAAIRLLTMAIVPVFDPSEARYATIAANMARSGDFVVPHFTYRGEYQSFDGKPPLVFQAGGLFARALGTDRAWKLQLAVRLFPFLSAVAALLVLFFTVREKSDDDTARLAVAIAASTSAFFAAAGLSMTDMTLAAAVASALLLYARDRQSAANSAAIGLALGLGFMTKGPVALVMFGLPVFADACVNRNWKKAFAPRHLAALPVFLAVAVPWFVLVERRNPGSVWYFFYNENFLRFVTHDYGDKYGAGREAFRGVSVLWALVACLPWTLVPFARGWKGLKAMRGLRSFEFLAVSAIVGFWCLTSRVLLYYLFPVMPLFAAYLALHGERRLLAKLAPFAASITVVAIVGALAGGQLFTDKMLGPSAPDTRGHLNRYSYEFYHQH